MDYLPWLKYISKMTTLLIGTLVTRPFLDIAVILHLHLGLLLKSWLGQTGIFIAIAIESIGPAFPILK